MSLTDSIKVSIARYEIQTICDLKYKLFVICIIFQINPTWFSVRYLHNVISPIMNFSSHRWTFPDTQIRFNYFSKSLPGDSKTMQSL